MDDLPTLAELEAAADQSRVNFLEADLDLCFTFADVAKTRRETGDRIAAHSVLEMAETGYAAILRISAHVESPDHKNHIERKLADLRAKLDNEQHLLNAPPT